MDRYLIFPLKLGLSFARKSCPSFGGYRRNFPVSEAISKYHKPPVIANGVKQSLGNGNKQWRLLQAKALAMTAGSLEMNSERKLSTGGN